MSLKSSESCETTQKHSPDDSSENNTGDKTKKKTLQMIRNRISAQNSRDRKKAYIRRLENQQRKTVAENMELQRQVRALKQANESLKSQSEQLKRGLMTCMGEAYEKLDLGVSGLNQDSMNIEFKNDFEAMLDHKYGFYDRKSDNGSNETTIAKYSNALATLFAVLMYSNNNMNSAGVQNLQVNQSFGIGAKQEKGK